MKRFRFLLLATVLLWGGCASSRAQTATFHTPKTTGAKALSLFEKGKAFSRHKQYEKAIRAYEKAIKKDPVFIDALYRVGGLYYNQKEEAKAKSYFTKVLQLNPDFSPRIYYALAAMAAKEKHYQEAAQKLEKYLTYPKVKGRNRTNAQKKLANYRFAAKAIQHPLPFKPKNLGPAINTADPEYTPSFTADEQYLIFTRRVHRQEDFYISRKVNGQFQPATPMTNINTDENEGAQCISSDGRFLAMTICGRRQTSVGSCDIYFSRKENGHWTAIKNIGSRINSKNWDGQPSLSANGNALYFASERPGGKGDRDIWVSYKNQLGKWGIPQNLGDSINTTGADQAPFIHPDGKTLYFMSDGHPGMGGSDLFFSKKRPDGSWSKAKNLGYPINDTGNQGALVVSLDGRKAYFAGPQESAAEGDYFGGTIDIFEFEMPAEIRPDAVTYVKGHVVNTSKKELKNAAIELVDLNSGKPIYQSTSDEHGDFLAVLPKGDYALNISLEGYLFYSENYALTQPGSLTQPSELTVTLQPIQTPGTSHVQPVRVILKNVFFDSGSAHLQSSSNYELDKIYDLLHSSKDLVVQINGHTDNVGSERDNLLLSEQRAKAVYDYLVQKGIPTAQLRYKGFGESQPIDTNDTEAGRQHNRRTEMEIVER